MTADWTDGDVERVLVVEVEHIPNPTPAQWEVLDAHRLEVASFTPRIFSQTQMRELVAEGTLGVYEISSGGTSLGTMVLEMIDWAQGRSALTVIWLRLTPGTLSRQVKRAILRTWKQVLKAHGMTDMVIQGRPGWETILAQENLRPKELSRVWYAKVR